MRRAYDPKDILAGVTFIAFGAFFSIEAYLSLRMGTIVRMGPGYVPFVLGLILAGLGAAIFLRGFIRTGELERRFAWRGLVMTLLALGTFTVFAQRLGLLITLPATIFVSAYSSRDIRLIPAIALAVLLSAFCILVLLVGLRVPLPLIGPWLR